MMPVCIRYRPIAQPLGPTTRAYLRREMHNAQHGRFKLIPSILSGPFIVRKAVGSKPALLGRKVRQRYFRGPDYVETDIGELHKTAGMTR